MGIFRKDNDYKWINRAFLFDCYEYVNKMNVYVNHTTDVIFFDKIKIDSNLKSS
jgi:hypothetical protein